MSYVSGTATDVGDLLTKLDAFLQLGHSLDPLYAGAGTGTVTGLIGTSTSVLETITVTFSDAANFTVAGSVSGALGAGTVGVAFACAVCAFTIVAGGVAWAAADTVTVLMTPPWTRARFSTTANDVTAYCCWSAPGNDGVSAIYVAAQRINNVTGDYDNLRLNGYTAHDAGLNFWGQAGGMTSNSPLLPLLRVGNIPYWFAANGRRVAIVAKCSTVYTSAYLGLLTPYISPSAVPYPLVVGGSLSYHAEPAATSTNWRWSYQVVQMAAFCKPAVTTAYVDDYTCRMRRTDGIFAAFSANTRAGLAASGGGLITPETVIGTDLRASLDGSYPLLPIVLSESNPNNVWGELDGVGWVSGHANAAENTVTQNRIAWLVVQNVYRNTKTDYFALKLA
jgi:hypothetical protein